MINKKLKEKEELGLMRKCLNTPTTTAETENSKLEAISSLV